MNERDVWSELAKSLAGANGSAPPAAPPRISPEWLPPTLGGYCEDLADCWRQSPDPHITVGICALLVTIGGNVDLRLPGGDVVPACDWFALVGASGSGKTPIMLKLIEPLMGRQREFDEDYRRRVRAWRRALREGGQAAREAGDRPVSVSLLFDDTTFEALTVGLSESADCGSLWYSDELLGLFNSLDAYKQRSGRSMQGLLTLWRAGPIRRRRIKDAELTIVPHPVVSILGGIQPRKLHELGSNDDGRLARMIAIPVEMGADTPQRDPTPGLAQAWAETLLGILDSRPVQRETLTLSSEAEMSWRMLAAKQRIWLREFSADEQELYAPFVAKLEQHVGRITLALWAGIHGCAWPLPPVDKYAVERAWALGDVYFQHQLQVFTPVAFQTGQRPFEVEHADAVDRFNKWLQARFSSPAKRRDVQMQAPPWIRAGGTFHTLVDGWRKRGYGEQEKQGRTLVLTWETSE